MKKIAIILLLLLIIPASSHAAVNLLGTVCSAQQEGYTACNLNGCYKCSSLSWVQQPLVFGNSAAGCSSEHAGLIRWTGESFQGCNGTEWVLFTSVDVDPALGEGTSGDGSTVMLLHFNGANGSTTITDSSASAHAMTAGGVTLTTSTYKFGGSSAYFNGSARMTTPDSTDFLHGTNDFTMDFWLNTTSTANTYILMSPYSGAGNGWNYYSFSINSTAGKLLFYGNYYYLYTTSNVNDGVWHHIAAVKSGVNSYLFVDGVLEASNASNLNITYPTGNPFNFGSTYEGTGKFTGYIDEFRISKGIARWTSNFTPPTAPY